MKKILFLLVFNLFNSNIYSQNITIQELSTLLLNKKWKQIDIYLNQRGFEYFDSKKYEDDNSMAVVTWSYQKDRYSDKAKGWISCVIDEEGKPCRINYEFFNKSSYNLGLNGVLNFQSVENIVNDEQIVSKYQNNIQYLKITTLKRDNNDFSQNSSITSWYFSLTNKYSKLDGQNGYRAEKYDNGNIKIEYSVTNNIANGDFKAYYENGTLMKTGTFINDKIHGLIVGYDEDGIKREEYQANNGKKHGYYKSFYNNGNIKKTGSYKNDVEEGKFTEYYEDGKKSKEYTIINGDIVGILKAFDEQGRIFAQLTYEKEQIRMHKKIFNEDNTIFMEQFQITDKQEQKQGLWLTFQYEKGKIIDTLEYVTFKDNKKYGLCKTNLGDSTIIAEYENDILNGKYTLYEKEKLYDADGKLLYVPASSISAQGFYKNGLKNGKWIYYNISMFKTKKAGLYLAEIRKMIIKQAEGMYENDKKEGKWYYYQADEDLQAEINYNEDKKQGLEKVFLHERRVPKESEYGLSHTIFFDKVTQYTNFFNDKKEGECFLKDSLNRVIYSGYFQNDLKHGVWIEADSIYYEEGTYNEGRREGKWSYYQYKGTNIATYNYKNNKLDGEYIVYLKNSNKKDFIRYYQDGIFTGIKIFNNDIMIESCIRDDVDKNYSKWIYQKNNQNGYESKTYIVLSEISQNGFLTNFKKNISDLESAKDYYPNGIAKQYDLQGRVISEGKLFKSRKQDFWVYTDYKQSIKIEIEYSYSGEILKEKYYVLGSDSNLFSGKYIYIDEVTGVKEERKIKNGIREGKTIYINKEGKKIKKENYKNGILQDK